MQNRVLLTLGAVSRFLHLWKRQHNIHLFTACTHIPRIIKMQRLYIHLKICLFRDLPGSPIVETLPSSERGAGLIPGWRAKIVYPLWLNNQI